MRRAIAKRVAALAVLAGMAGISSAAAPPGGLDAALALAKVEGVDGVVTMEKEIMVGKDGRVIARIRETQKMMTDHAVDSWGDPAFAYNAAHQEIRVVAARSKRADGTITDHTENALNVVTPAGIVEAPFFTDVQEMVVTILGLEVGAAAEVEVEIEDTDPFPRLVHGVERFHDGRGIAEKSLSIGLPAGRELDWWWTGMDVAPDVEASAKTTEYTFRASNLRPVNAGEAPALTGPGLPVLYWMEKVPEKDLAGRLLSSAPCAIPGREAECVAQGEALSTTLLAELDDEAWSPARLAAAIHDRVASGLAQVEIDRSLFGDEWRTPGEALGSGYADAAEKLGILHTVATDLGWKPVAMVSLRHDPGPGKRLHPANVDGLWIRASVDGRFLYLDASSAPGAGEPRGEHVFVLSAEGLSRPDFLDPASTGMRLDAVVDLTGKEPKVSGTLSLRGDMNPFAAILSSGVSDPAATVASILGDDSGMEVGSASFVSLSLAETVVSFEGVPTIEDSILDVRLPSPLAGRIAGEWEPWRLVRTLPIAIEDRTREKVRVEILLPEGATVLHAPSFVNTGGKVGPVSVFHSVGLDAEHVSLSRRVTIDPGTLGKDAAYEAITMMAEALAGPSNRIVVQLPAG